MRGPLADHDDGLGFGRVRGRRLTAPGGPEHDACGDDAFGLKAWIPLLKLQERLHQRSGAHEQEDRERDLCDNQRRSDRRARRATRAVPNGYRGQDDASYYPALVRTVASVPRIQAVTLASYFPSYFGLEHLLQLQRVGRADGAIQGDAVEVVIENVTPGFFETLGISLMQGRDFSWSDEATRLPVVVISDSLRQGLFSEGTPLGQRVRIGAGESTAVAEIIGVAADAAVSHYRRPDAGEFLWKGKRYKGLHEPVIPMTLFEQVQEVFDGTSRPKWATGSSRRT